MYGTQSRFADFFAIFSSRRVILLGALALGLALGGRLVLAQVEEKPAETPVAKPAEKKPEAKTDATAKAEKPAQKKDDAQKPAANPLKNLFRGIFGGVKPQQGIIPQNPQNAGNVKEPANGDTAARDRIDARAPFDPTMAKLLRRAEKHMEAARAGDDEEWALALQILKHILDPSRPTDDNQPVENSLIRGPDGKLTTMRHEANRLLSEFPPARLASYREEFGGLAGNMFEDAKRNGNIEQIVTVATQFFHTPAGQEAANWMGMRHFDHGEFGMAARWFRQLLKYEAGLTQDRHWLLKAAVAFHQAGDEKASRELLEKTAGISLRVGEKPVSPVEFLARLNPEMEARVPVLDDWPMLYGTPSHLAKAQGGDPLLLSRWSQPLTNSHRALESIDELVDDLNDEQLATVPAFSPIMVDGKVIFRTLGGVRVVEAKSGQMLWETRAGISPESLLTGVQNTQPQYMQQMAFMGGFPGNSVSYYTGNGANFNALTSLLFRDGTWGTISSDSEQLFVLEDHAVMLPYQPGNYWAFRDGMTDAHRRDYSTNKIVSYHLETGRPRWEIGGTEMDEPFDRRLAGQYFFGVPVADQGELFVIGERDNEIRLFTLDRETGRPIWSQLVAYSDAKIERDFGRRWWNAQAGVSRGVLVCPTTVGWLVAIDRLNHSVLWAHRYTEPNRAPEPNRFNDYNNNLVPQSSLNTVWGPSAPIIAGHRVVYAPPEDATLVCLDLFTGEKLWSRQKEDNLYLAGVFENQAVVVGKTSASAISMETGSTLWSLSWEADDGKPCGMGVAVGNVYHLPLSSGQLWTLDLNGGKVLAKSQLPDDLPQLGNLGMYRGMLLSLGPKGLTAYAQQQAIEQEILARRKQNPRDSWADLFEANIQSLKQNHDPALELLRKVEPEKLSPQDQTRYRSLMMASLTELLRADFRHRDKEFGELEAFVKSDEERLTFRRLTADRLSATGDFASAFDEYLELADSNGSREVARDDDPRVRLSLERWLSGRLEQLWRNVSGDDRARLDERIAATAEAAKSQDALQAERFLLLFGFHPAAVTVRRALVEEFALAGDVARAENQLLKLSRDPDDRVAAMALKRLARLFRDQGFPRDANYYYKRLEERFPKVRLEDGKQVSVLLAELKAGGKFGSPASQPVAWSDAKIEELRTGTNYSYGNQEHDLQYSPYRLPYFQDRRLRFFYTDQHLGVTKAATDEMEWLIPLRRGPDGGPGQSNMMPADTSGHLLFVVHYGVLHALSPIDRKILWTYALDPKAHQNSYYSNSNAPLPMQSNRSLNTQQWLQQDGSRRHQQSALAVVNSDYVCVKGRRMISVHDAITGRLRWSKDRLKTNTLVYGTDSVVFLVPPDMQNAVALSATDGRRVDVPNLDQLMLSTIRILPGGMVLAESKASKSILGLSRGTTVMRFFDPFERRDRWTAEYPSGSYLALTDDDYLAALKPDGHLDLLDLETGKTQTMQGVTEDDLKSKTEVRVLADHDNVYLIINRKRDTSGRFYYYSDGNMATVTVNGSIFAWNRETGKFLWQQKVDDQKLVLMHFTHSPLLVFYTRMYKRVENFGFYATNTLAVDKFTGKKRVEVSAPTNYSGFQTYDLSLRERTLEMRSYQSRLRITALAPGTAEDDDGKSKPPKDKQLTEAATAEKPKPK